MGILDFLGGLGKAGGATGMQRLTSGMGSEGGLLQKMGMGQYGQQAGGQPPGMAGQMGQGKGWTDFLHGLGDQMGSGGGQQSGLPPAPNLMPGGGGGASPGLAELIAQYMKMNQRQ